MVAVLLAGGVGSRLRPLTDELPKALVRVGSRPVISILLSQLARSGFREIILCVNHRADQIMGAMGDGSQFGVSLRYSFETVPLSTIGPLRLISSLPEHFLVLNADILTDLPFAELLRYHAASERIVTVATTERSESVDFGVVQIADERILSFLEKPCVTQSVSMGVYAMHQRLLAMIPPDRPYGFDQLMHDLLAADEPVGAFQHTGFWLDIGRPTDYLAAQRETSRIDRWLSS